MVGWGCEMSGGEGEGEGRMLGEWVREEGRGQIVFVFFILIRSFVYTVTLDGFGSEEEGGRKHCTTASPYTKMKTQHKRFIQSIPISHSQDTSPLLPSQLLSRCPPKLCTPTQVNSIQSNEQRHTHPEREKPYRSMWSHYAKRAIYTA